MIFIIIKIMKLFKKINTSSEAKNIILINILNFNLNYHRNKYNVEIINQIFIIYFFTTYLKPKFIEQFKTILIIFISIYKNNNQRKKFLIKKNK